MQLNKVWRRKARFDCLIIPALTYSSSKGSIEVVTLLTRVLVDRLDPAFQRPTKPIGPWLKEPPSAPHIHDPVRGYRAVVASPSPVHVIEAPAIEALLQRGFVVVAGGGGGIPVVSGHEGISAVIDKDRTSALLGRQLGCNVLVIATDVEGVMKDFGKPTQQLLKEIQVGITPLEWVSSLPEGSMRPKLEAAIEFVRGRGPNVFAVIGHIDDLIELLQGTRGTRVVDGVRRVVAAKL